MNHILVTGARGQIGSDLVSTLRARYGEHSLIESDILAAPPSNGSRFLYEQVDVRHKKRLEEVIGDYKIDTVFHLASLLSATGEHRPDAAWEVNLGGLKNVLDIAKERHLKVFWPSSIAVFGPATPRHQTPQYTVLDPTTMYGITKVSGEFMCRYYAEKFEMDVRGIRYPGIISYTAPPGGGTTDYAVEIFYSALQKSEFSCFVKPETRLPMMYMPDAVRAAIELMESPPGQIHLRTSYNLAAISFTAEELATEIQKHLPQFSCRYEPDYHQQIADSWPETIDDSEARSDWNWNHEWNLEEIVRDMLEKLSLKLFSRKLSEIQTESNVSAPS